MGFITAVTALTPEVGGASGNWDLATDEIASNKYREYSETYDSYSIFGLSFNRFQVIYQINSQYGFSEYAPKMYKCTF
jgi:hypothetical protein